MLGGLEGQDFQDEVCAFLRRCVTDFQDVPAKPHGDAGLDGLSHRQTVAYCCYGPEQQPFKTNTRGLSADIVKKFRADLQTIFELEVKGRGKASQLLHRATDEMKTILASGRKIAVVRLIVSVFDSHRLLGPINEAFDKCCNASQCRYAEKSPSVTVWGPKQLAAMGAVDDPTLLRLEQREILRRVTATINSPPTLTLPLPADFDEKFDWIDSQGKVSKTAVDRLRGHFKKRWSLAIALENDLANNAVVLHQALSRAREEAALDADLASGTISNPTELLERMRQKVADRVDEQTGVRFPSDVRNQLVDGELARLIGECPIDWRT